MLVATRHGKVGALKIQRYPITNVHLNHRNVAITYLRNELSLFCSFKGINIIKSILRVKIVGEVQFRTNIFAA